MNILISCNSCFNTVYIYEEEHENIEVIKYCPCCGWEVTADEKSIIEKMECKKNDKNY